MGPRPDGRGKLQTGVSSQEARKRQWGRGQTAAESSVRLVSNIGGQGCQWGRGQTAAERARTVRALYGLGASMGPRPDGRGKLPRRAQAARITCVNGAAARRPRKGPARRRSRTTERCVNGAAARRPRKANGAPGAARPPPCVNGAAARRPRKASCTRSRRSPPVCVNGAAARRPRKAAA